MASQTPTQTQQDGIAINWDRALNEHRPWLRSVVAARLGEPQAIDDVMQEIAVAVSTNRAPLIDANKLAPWLYQIAVRQTLLYRRKHGRRRNLVGRYADRFQPSEEDNRDANPLEWLLAQERAERFRQAMEELSQRDREILLLKYQHGFSYKEISGRLSLSESAVEARLHRARKRLRKLLYGLSVVEQM